MLFRFEVADIIHHLRSPFAAGFPDIEKLVPGFGSPTLRCSSGIRQRRTIGTPALGFTTLFGCLEFVRHLSVPAQGLAHQP